MDTHLHKHTHTHTQQTHMRNTNCIVFFFSNYIYIFCNITNTVISNPVFIRAIFYWLIALFLYFTTLLFRHSRARKHACVHIHTSNVFTRQNKASISFGRAAFIFRMIATRVRAGKKKGNSEERKGTRRITHAHVAAVVHKK